MKTILVLAGALALALGGCQARIDARLPQICERVAEAHAAFIVVAATGTLPRGAVQKELVAWEGAKQLCASETIDIVTLAELYATIIIALRDAGGDGVKLADDMEQLRRDVIREGIR